MAEVAVRPRSVGNGKYDERYAPVVRKFGGEKQSPVSRNAHFPVAYVNDRAFPIGCGGRKLLDAPGIGEKRTPYR